MTTDAPPRIDFESPANAIVLRYLRVVDPATAYTTAPEDIDYMALGTHPDLVVRLWTLGRSLPRACACVIGTRSFPLLVHPGSGIIFGLAGGTSTLAFRLPEPELTAALAEPGFGHEYRYPGGPVRASQMGEDWALVPPYGEGNAALCARAFSHAARPA